MMQRIKSLINAVRQRHGSIIFNYLRYYWQASILHRDFMIKKVHGNKMYLNLKEEKGVSQALALYGTREILETEVAKREIKKGMVVFDLGANIGYYTLIAASIVGKSGKVYAVEPYPPNFELLKRNVVLNKYNDIVETEQIAIFNENGTLKLYLGKTNNQHSLIDYSFKWGEHGYIEVKTVAIDEFLKNKELDFLRMDVEGSELQIIDRLLDTIGNRKPPKILFETHPTGDIDPDPKFTPLVKKIVDFGYLPKTIVSSANEKSLRIFADLGYKPQKVTRAGKFYHGLFEDISPDDLIKVAFRRPKATRAILLVHQSDYN